MTTVFAIVFKLWRSANRLCVSRQILFMVHCG